jgi:hypothetical protein
MGSASPQPENAIRSPLTALLHNDKVGRRLKARSPT